MENSKLINLDALDKIAKELRRKALADISQQQEEIEEVRDMFGGKSFRYVLQEEYDNLSEEEKNDPSIVWSIIDAEDSVSKEYVDEEVAKINDMLQHMGEGIKAELDKKSNILNYSDHTLNGVETYNNLEKVIGSGSEAIYTINKPINLIEGTTCSIEVKFSDNTNLLLQGEVISVVLHEKQVNCIQITGTTGLMVIDKARYTIKDGSGTPEHDDNVSSLMVIHPNANNVISLTITKPTVFEINNSFFTDYQFVNDTEKENWNNKADKSELFSGDYNDLSNKPEILNSNITYINANDYTKKVINNEIDVNMSYINEYGNVNKFIFDSIKDDYSNKALIKSNDVYSVIDINVEEFTIDSNTQEIYFNLDDNNVCKKIIAQENCILEKIEVYNSINVQRIHLLNQVNEDMLLNLAKSLIDRNGTAWGSIIIKDQDIRKKVESNFIQKDWYFGSPKIYDATEKTKIQQYMYDSGIVDIWESAEYGEDAKLGIIDSGLRLDLAELDTTNFLGAVDLCQNNGKTRLESISVGTSTESTVTHGSAVYSLVAGKGVKYYGVAPKCSWYFIKITGEDGFSSTEAIAQAPIVAIQNKLEFCTMSFSSSILSSQVGGSSYGDKLYYDILREYVEECNGIFNTSVKNNYNYLQAYKLYSSWKPACMTHAAYLNGGVYKRIDSSTAYNAPFTSYSYLYANAYGNTYKYFNGSSCAAPVMTGIYMLVSNIFKKKHGRRPSKYELVELLKNRTVQCRNKSGAISEDPTLVGYGLINVMAYRDVSHITISCAEREDE